ncbi:retropepsin-like aspartic protease [Aestuariibaculum sediminum]|uniref:Clan AA aspartic protease n=1 Tax=Aestuariibaculum sediminum TaxID=2770637 RepID=A0A8J6Q7S9_9FLAO|nr:retropepsin-like aspartic protease [Aestuariibaculum sediminum]MBD0832803.1 clan AA aspartic protease [Aestuariibaculum sediminum]
MKFKLIIFILFTYTGSFSQQVNLNKGKTPKDFFEIIQFEVVKNKIILPVTIADKTYRFILDTGAPNMISNEIENLLQPKKAKIISITDSNNKTKPLKLITLKNLKLGESEFRNIPTLVYDLKNDPIFKCFEIDGLIGSNMLRHSILKLDMQAKTLTLTDNTEKLILDRNNFEKIEYTDKQSGPRIWVDLKGKDQGKELILIDTGMSNLYSLSKTNYNILKTKDIFHIKGKSTGASGLGLFGETSKNEHHKLLLPSLNLCNVNLRNVVTQTSDDDHSKIGSQILQYGTLTIDYKHKRLYFDTKSITIPVNYSDLGFSFSVKNENLIIGFVWDEKLKKQINYGDKVIAINDQPINLCEVITSEIISKDTKTFTLKILPLKGRMFEMKLSKN